MNTSRYRYQFTAQRHCVALIVLFFAAGLSACSSLEQPESPDPFTTFLPGDKPEVEPTATQTPRATRTATVTLLPTDTPTPTPTFLPQEGTTFSFEAGHYDRDDYCFRTFDYHLTTEGALTVVVADNLIDPIDSQELAGRVLLHYEALGAEFPALSQQAITVYIIEDPDVGNCFSQDALVFVSPEALNSRSFANDLAGAAIGGSEYWVQEGLGAVILGEQPDEDTLKAWYQNTDDLDMAGLFIARFAENWASQEEIEIAHMSAASLVQYALQVEGIQPDALTEQVDNAVRTRWLNSMGVDRTVTYPHDGRFAGFEYSQVATCGLLVQADTMAFCLNSTDFNTIAEAEFLIDQAYSGHQALAVYLMAEAPSVSEKIDPEAMLMIDVMDSDAPLGYFIRENNQIYISPDALPGVLLLPVVHSFEWNTAMDQTWLIFGFAEYLGKYLTIYPQPEKACIFDELNGGVYVGENSDIEPGTSACHYLDPEQLAAAKAWYLAQGGEMDTEQDIAPRMYADAVSFATLYRDAQGGLRGATIAEKFSALNPALTGEGQDGVELSFTQAASLIGWMCDTYTLDRVLDVYVNGAEDGLLDGKSYEELKAEWQAYLMEKGEGIEIPEQP